MIVNRMILNETSYFGENSREMLAYEIKKNKYKKVLLVSDTTLMEVGVTEKIIEVLKNNDIEYSLFTGIKPNPTVENVKEGVSTSLASLADVIVAVGGGSVIDTAKAIGIITNNPEYSDVVSLGNNVGSNNKSLPIIAIPTTAGTAAEVTINYVITDEENMTKMVIVDPNDIPIVAIIDPVLMKDMPRGVAASTGMDALTHAIEGYITKAAWVMTDTFHIKAVQIINDNIVSAVNEKNIENINNMGIAQYMAGMGFSNVGLGIVHSLAHQLGAVYDTPHGLANAMLLPYVLKFNGGVCIEKFKDIAEAMNKDIASRSDQEVVDIVVDAVIELNDKLGIPRKLNEVGIKEEDLMMLSEKALIDPCTGGNPRDVTVNDLFNIYKEAL